MPFQNLRPRHHEIKGGLDVITLRSSLLVSAALATVATVLTPLAAFAHHPMGGATPSTLWQGFASGVGHPVIGLDHLAFIVAIGLMAALAGARVLVPLAFVAATALGCVLHLNSVSLPAGELVIAGSVLFAGLVVSGLLRLPVLAIMGLVGLAGVAHGHAYGEAIFGAEQAQVYAYLAGFSAVQLMIAVTTAALAARALAASQATGVRVSGALIAGVGVATVWPQMISLALPGMAG